MIYVEKVFPSSLISPVLSVERLCVVVDSLISAAKVVNCVIPEVVDRENSSISLCSCYKNIVYMHKNASWVLSLRDFVLKNQFWAQGRCVLGLFSGISL